MAEDLHDVEFSKRHRCCFWVPFFSSGLPSSQAAGGSPVFWQRIKPADSAPATPTASDASGETWWVRKWKKLREWSELVAGPRWKTFIRGFGNKRRRGGYGKFQYDPMSYALNFDEGQGRDGHFDEDLVGRGFSARYSLPPSTKTSLDFDREGLVVVTEWDT